MIRCPSVSAPELAISEEIKHSRKDDSGHVVIVRQLSECGRASPSSDWSWLPSHVSTSLGPGTGRRGGNHIVKACK